MSDTVTSRYTRVCLKPIGHITYRGPGGYKDTQNIMPGRDPQESIDRRFPGGVPDGWTVEITIWPVR